MRGRGVPNTTRTFYISQQVLQCEYEVEIQLQYCNFVGSELVHFNYTGAKARAPTECSISRRQIETGM